MPGWQPDEEFLRREREMMERRRTLPEYKERAAGIRKMQERLAAMDPESKEASDLRWRIHQQIKWLGMFVRPVQ